MKKRNKLEARVLLHLSPSRVAAGASLGADWNSGCMNSSQYDMPYSRFGTTGPSWHPPQSHLRNEGTTGSLGMLSLSYGPHQSTVDSLHETVDLNPEHVTVQD